MKRTCLVLIFALLCTLLLCTVASANNFGLKGKLHQIVMTEHIWDDYTMLSNQAENFAVMKTRYHHALFFADDLGKLHVYTTAVYQPEDKKKAPSLFLHDGMLYMSYSDQETYVFQAIGEDGEYQLFHAELGDFQLNGNFDEKNMCVLSYWANEEGNTALWPVTIRLQDFNIDLLPHSVEEVRIQNRLHAQFDSAMQCLGIAHGSGNNYSPDEPGQLFQPKKKGTVPVYSSPFGKSAWRSGKGKAAVELNGDLWLLSEFKNANEESYACIRYNVSEKAQRIGYVLCKDLGLPEITKWNPDEPLTGFAHVDVETIEDTYLTDDPNVSQYPHFQVSKGTQFTCLGLYNDYYAYVSAEMKNGKFVDGGAIVWGFIPIRDLKVVEQELAPEAMGQLIGNWMLCVGDSMADDYLFLHEDGSFITKNMQWKTGDVWQNNNTSKNWGIWYVTKYNSFMNLYWNKPPYQLTLLYNNGRVLMRGLEITDEGFSLTDAEGGGGYLPIAEADIELIEELR